VEKNFFVRNYRVILEVWFIAVIAFVIFFMHFARAVQIGSLIVAAALFIWIFSAGNPDDPPAGAEVSGEPVARSRGGFQV
jgi:hypothetical protein